jgi:hypothetical protein
MQCCLDSDIYFKLRLVRGHCTWFGLFVTDSDLDVSEFSFGKDCLKHVSDNPIFFNNLFISSFIHSFNSYSAFLTWLCQIGFHTSFWVAASNCHCSINSWQISLQINFWTDPIWQNHMRNTIKSYLISTLQISLLLPPPPISPFPLTTTTTNILRSYGLCINLWLVLWPQWSCFW